jgi:hypothetical protein
VIVKTVNGDVNGGEISYYNAPPEGCPQHVVDRYNYICRLSVEFGSGAAETARLEREQYSLKEKVAAGLGRILYGA